MCRACAYPRWRGPAPGSRRRITRQRDRPFSGMNTTEIKRIIREEGLRPAKRRGQNFLVDSGILEKIIVAVAPSRDDRILEIGPGLGALTGPMIERAGRVTAVEIDSGFYRYLAKRFGDAPNFSLLHDDVLRTEPRESYTKIVSNLPYYCSSEILFWMARREAPLAYVMVQKELAGRITAGAGEKNYGALSVTLGFHFESRVLFPVSRGCFHPRPEVDSSFLALRRREPPPLGEEEAALFLRLVRSAFWGRRKTMLRSLGESPHLDLGREGAARILERAGIAPAARGEDLAPDRFMALARAWGEDIQRGAVDAGGTGGE